MSEGRDRVLVTGGTGYLGGWCVATLLERGYAVRTTVRSLTREGDVRAAVAAAGVADDGALEVSQADLTSDAGWSAAVTGCRYVLHVASPFPPKQPKNPDDLIVPARDGALRVLSAALDADVERIVMTSSVAAVRGSRPPTDSAIFTEADWTDGDDSSKSPYVRSKATAERAAWDYVDERGERQKLVAINPGAIIGPALSDDRSFSLQLIERLLGGLPAMPRLGFSVVDVRDVAEMHVLAMTDPDAGGERFIATDEFLWMKDIAAILRERLGSRGRKVPTRVAPDLMIKGMALFDSSVKSIVSDLGQKSVFSSEKARTGLGWQPRPVADSIQETAESLFAHGAISAPD